MKITALFLAFAAAYGPGSQTEESQRTVSNWGSPALPAADGHVNGIGGEVGQAEDVWGTAETDEDNQGNVYVRNGVSAGVSATSEAKYGAREIAQNKDTDFDDFSAHHQAHAAAVGVDVEHFDEGDAKAIAVTQDMSASAAHVDQFDRVHAEQAYNNKAHDYSNPNYQDNTANIHANLDQSGLTKGYKHTLTDQSITQDKHDHDYRNTAGSFSHGDFEENGQWGIRENSKDQDSTIDIHTRETGRGGDSYDAGIKVNRHCVRKTDQGVPIEIVPYGWTGVGHGTKYCFLEVCNSCSSGTPINDPSLAGLTSTTHFNSVNEDEHHAKEMRSNTDFYCEMEKKHEAGSALMGADADGGACGIHKGKQNTHTCEYVTCTYTNGGSMEVSVKQTNADGVERDNDAHPEVSPFKNGRQHECRPKYDGTSWSCTCNCYDDTPLANKPIPSFSENNKQGDEKFKY